MYNYDFSNLENKTVDEIVDLAMLIATRELNLQEEFLVPELFPSFIWKRIPKNIRHSVGKSFKNLVLLGKNPIIFKETTKQNHKKYVRV